MIIDWSKNKEHIVDLFIYAYISIYVCISFKRNVCRSVRPQS